MRKKRDKRLGEAKWLTAKEIEIVLCRDCGEGYLIPPFIEFENFHACENEFECQKCGVTLREDKFQFHNCENPL